MQKKRRKCSVWRTLLGELPIAHILTVKEAQHKTLTTRMNFTFFGDLNEISQGHPQSHHRQGSSWKTFWSCIQIPTNIHTCSYVFNGENTFSKIKFITTAKRLNFSTVKVEVV